MCLHHAPKAPPTPTKSTAETAAASPALGSRRRKLWELAHRLHCPVIGTCLETAALRRLARKASGEPVRPPRDYEVHLRFVAAAESRNALAVAVQKDLERRYAREIRASMRCKGTDQLSLWWATAQQEGRVAGGLWAVLTHPACDPTLSTRVYEDIHMLSHQVGAGQRADLQALAEAREEVAQRRQDLADALRRHRRQHRELVQRNQELEARLAERQAQQRQLQAMLTAREAELAALRAAHTGSTVEQLHSALQHSEAERQRLTRERLHWLRDRHAIERRLRDRQIRLTERTAECQALERQLASLLPDCARCANPECAEQPDLGGRRILCVGGRTHMIGQFRALVQQCNGRFEHHDGGLEHKRQGLEPLLQGADTVICATDCVSHDAYYRLKRVCKHRGTPFMLLPSSGLSSFARALQSLGTPDPQPAC